MIANSYNCLQELLQNFQIKTKKRVFGNVGLSRPFVAGRRKGKFNYWSGKYCRPKAAPNRPKEKEIQEFDQNTFKMESSL